MSDEKKKMNYYYAGKEKNAQDIRKDEQITPYGSTGIQRDFDRLMDRLQREIEDFWGPPTQFRREMHRWPGSMMPFKEAMPSVDLEDQGKAYRLTVDMPGFKKEDVNAQISDDYVTINAKRTQAEEEKNKNYIRRERAAQTYYRRIPLPEPIRSDEAKASLKDGILEITLPKKEPKETKKLEIA